jgi:hypothetical protein
MILSEEEVVRIRGRNAIMSHAACLEATYVCDSHEALRAKFDALAKEVAELRKENRSVYPLLREKIRGEMAQDAARFKDFPTADLLEKVPDLLITIPVACHAFVSALACRLVKSEEDGAWRKWVHRELNSDLQEPTP